MKYHQKKIATVTFAIIFVITIPIYACEVNNNDNLDQQQDEHTNIKFIYGDNFYAQKIIANYGKLTRVELLLATRGNVQNKLTLSIREDIDGQDITNISLEASEISSKKEWIEFNFSDIPAYPNNRYYIVCRSKNGDIDNNYLWYIGENTSYSRGTAYQSLNGGTSWEPLYNFDFCFRTYGINNNESKFDIPYVKGESSGLLGEIYFEVLNTGPCNIHNITINAKFSGAFIFLGREYINNFDFSVKPEEEIHITIHPIIGFGPANFSIDVTAPNIDNYSKIVDVFLLPFYVYIKQS